jgi:exodeoxyribonuclease-1
MLVRMAEPSFFFYDLETSGFGAATARIMQFAGQRTDMDLNPLGEPFNVLIKLTADILPDPGAIMITGITPQKTLADGVSEAEFLKLFYEEIALPGTTFMGYNTVRFDDEFMRHLMYRNFYDAYEWEWSEGRSRWDLLDVVRMTRALRPANINWPFLPDGKPTNRLEYLSAINELAHEQAHDAMSDVLATIGLARLIRERQPELFGYMFKLRSKQAVKELVLKGQPFMYSSGRYPSEHLHTTAAVLLAPHPEQDAALVYDLRYDPTDFVSKTPAQLADHWRFSKDPEHVRLPVKTLKYNRCPAVAPLGVLDEAAQERLKLPLDTVKKHHKTLLRHKREFAAKVFEAVRILDDERKKEQAKLFTDERDVDERLYDGFFGPGDKAAMQKVRRSSPADLSTLRLSGDERLSQLLPLYKARNYPSELSTEEKKQWDDYCRHRLQDGGAKSRLARFAKDLQTAADTFGKDKEKQYLLEELQLYAESIVQIDETDEAGAGY